jgi:ribosomal-protein-alanine N-acetyltransferase
MQIAAMTVDDLGEVAALEALVFRNPWGRQAFVSELACRQAYDFVLKAGSRELVGYACFRLVMGELHLLKVAVRKKYRQQGIAPRFIRQCMERIPAKVERVFLEVRPSNEAAIRLYEKLGFGEWGRRPGYYLDTGEDAILMGRTYKGGSYECKGSNQWNGKNRENGVPGRPEPAGA